MPRVVIAQALSLIKRTETCQLHEYHGKADPRGVMTVGFGHVEKPGEHLAVITQQQADELFAKDVASHVQFIQHDVGDQVVIDDWMYGALASFCYNLGPRILHPANSITMQLRAGRPKLAALNFYKYSNADKRYCDGLFYRRLTESALAILHSLVPKPDDCREALALVKQLQVGGPVQPLIDFFSQHHHKESCRVCKHH